MNSFNKVSIGDKFQCQDDDGFHTGVVIDVANDTFKIVWSDREICIYNFSEEYDITKMEIDLNDYEEVPEKSVFNCYGCAFYAPDEDKDCNHPDARILNCGNKGVIFVKKEKVTTNDTEHNVISKPKHYMLFPEKNIEVRDLMQVLADRLESNGYSAMFISDYIQMQQYLLRFDEKNKKEDLEKAQWYLGKLIESKDFDA